jgi:hypothetical protein
MLVLPIWAWSAVPPDIAPAWSPLSLFAASEQGAWYDPTDLTRYMSVEGSPEQFPNGDFASSDISAWQLVTGSNAWSSGVFSVTGATWLDFATTVGKTYLLSAQLTPTGTYSADLTLWQGGGFSVPLLGDTHTTAARTKVGSFTATAATTRIYVRALAGAGSVNVDNISVREIPLISQATMYQDAAGTTPVTAVEQPVGLILDRRLGALGALGEEKITGSPSPYTGNGTVSVASGVITATCTANGAYGIRWANMAVTQPGRYVATLEVVTNSASRTIALYPNLSGADVPVVGLGAKWFIPVVVAATGSGADPSLVVFSATAGESFSVRLVSLRLVPGNHASQATSTARPTLRNRYNLLTHTEDYSNAVWAKTNLTRTTGVADPFGGNGATTLTASGGSGRMYIAVPVVANASYTGGFYIRRRTGTGNINWEDFQVGVGGSVTVTSEWAKVTVTSSTPVTTAYLGLRIATAGDAIDIFAADFLPAADASLPYQRVTTATDYDSDPAKFPFRLNADGSDDSLELATLATINATAGAFELFVAFRFGDVNTNSASAWLNDSMFGDAAGWAAPIYARSSGHIGSSGGTSNGQKVEIAADLRARHVWHARLAGGQLTVSLDGGPEQSVACANWGSTAGAMWLFRSLGGYTDGHLHELIFRDGSVSAEDRASAISYLKTRWGVA